MKFLGFTSGPPSGSNSAVVFQQPGGEPWKAVQVSNPAQIAAHLLAFNSPVRVEPSGGVAQLGGGLSATAGEKTALCVAQVYRDRAGKLWLLSRLPAVNAGKENEIPRVSVTGMRSVGRPNPWAPKADSVPALTVRPLPDKTGPLPAKKDFSLPQNLVKPGGVVPPKPPRLSQSFLPPAAKPGQPGLPGLADRPDSGFVPAQVEETYLVSSSLRSTLQQIGRSLPGGVKKAVPALSETKLGNRQDRPRQYRPRKTYRKTAKPNSASWPQYFGVKNRFLLLAVASSFSLASAWLFSNW